MSLLLEARKKAQSAQAGDRDLVEQELSLEEQPNATSGASDPARSAGLNLFSAKAPALLVAHPGINRYLLLALGGTILLLTAGAGYWYHLDSASNTQPLRTLISQPGSIAPAAEVQPPRPEIKPPNTLVAEIAAANPAEHPPPKTPAAISMESASAELPRPRKNSPIRIEQQKTGFVDPLLGGAYLAYRSGKLGVAQQLYREMLRKDANNTDALLGLAAIAQRQGDTTLAAQYYSRMLVLDPRNAEANAGMSALTTDDNSESRLKTLLNEQNNSAVLHFALGNHYAEQSRWGDAQQAYFKAYTLESGNAGFAFNLAVSLDHLGQGKMAAQYYQRALQLDQAHGANLDHDQISQRLQELPR